MLTYEAILAPRALPLPAGMGRRPFSPSLAPAVAGGWVSALETASLNLRVSVSNVEPSWTAGGEVLVGGGAGEPFREKFVRDNLVRGRARASVESDRDIGAAAGGAGEDGRLRGLKR
jgi:hypothetical protein